MIIIGGYNETYYTDNVVRYDINGIKTPLPSLRLGRLYHGCFGYYNDVGNLVSKNLYELAVFFPMSSLRRNCMCFIIDTVYEYTQFYLGFGGDRRIFNRNCTIGGWS